MQRARMVFPPLLGVVKKLLVGLFVAYVLQLVIVNWVGVRIDALLALTPGGLGVWQLATYVLIDPGHPLMFLIGLVFIWWALSPIEAMFGARRTLQLCATVVIAASVPVWLVGFVIEASPPLAGSQPLWFGGVAATAWIARGRPMSLFGVLSMTAIQFLWLLVGVSVLMFLASKNHSYLLGDLGAIAGGIGFVRWLQRPKKKRAPRIKAAPRNLHVIQGGGGEDERPRWLN